MISYFVAHILVRSYSFLLLTFLSLCIGAFLFGGVVALTSTVNTFLVREGKVLVGGDIVFRSAYPIATSTPAFLEMKEEGHTLIEEKQVQAVFTNGTSSSPARIRLVEDAFPLYGEVLIESGVFGFSRENLIYGDEEFARRLSLSVGDRVSLGEGVYTFAGILIKEPDSVSLGVSFTPRVIMRMADFSSSKLLLDASRTSYRIYVKENSAVPFTDERVETLRDFARDARLRFDDARDGPNNLIRGMNSVDTFIGIVLAVALFLVTVNIGANLVYVLARFKKTIAILKTFGATSRQIQYIYMIVLGIVGGTAGFLGSLLGGSLVAYYLPRIAEKFHTSVTEVPLLQSTMLGTLFGIIFIVVSAIPFLVSLREVTPKSLLSTVTPSKTPSLKRMISFVGIPVLLFVTLFLISSDTILVLYSAFGLVALFFTYACIAYYTLALLYAKRNSFSFLAASVIAFLRSRGVETAVTTASLMTALSGIFIVSAIEKSIVVNIEQNISATAPALYLVDIQKSQRESVRSIVGKELDEYPIIRGRLLSLNGKDITQSDNPGLTREFNMTYRNTLIDGERMLEGEFNEGQEEGPVVSVDKGFGDELGGVAIGDTITVFIQGITISAKVTSIREVDSTSGIPFFYLVFPERVLEKFPGTSFATVQGGGEEINRIKQALATTHPNIIPIETKVILDTVRGIVENMVALVTLTGLPSILLGCILLIVMIWQSLYERRNDVLVLRAFGLTKNRIIRLFILEAGVLVVCASILAYAIAHAVSFALGIFVFDFNVFSFSYEPFFITLGSLVIVCICAYVLARSIVQTSLKNLLAEK